MQQFRSGREEEIVARVVVGGMDLYAHLCRFVELQCERRRKLVLP